MSGSIFTTMLMATVIAVPGVAQTAAETRKDPPPIRTTPFPDVPRDHWAFDAVEDLRQRGILRGYPAGKPTPKKTQAYKVIRNRR